MGEESNEENKPKVVIENQAMVTMALHALRYKNEPVHGLLLGTHSSGSNVTLAQAAVPISHTTPTLPLVEIALGLVHNHLLQQENKTSNTPKRIVGWYYGPSLAKDVKPSPVALRIAASLASQPMEDSAGQGEGGDPVLLVLQNMSLATCLRTGKAQKNDEPDKRKNAFFLAFGKDFGQQWLEPLLVTVNQAEAGCKALNEALARHDEIFDLEEHLEGSADTPWFMGS